MSNRRKLRSARVPACTTLDRLVGHQVVGGCEDCDAYTRFLRDDLGAYIARVFHDDSCPTWRRVRRARDERKPR